MQRNARAAVLAALTTGGLLAGASAAQAAVQVTYTANSGSGTITATGDAANDTILVKGGTTPSRLAVTVQGATLADPDGNAANCTAAGDTVECAASFASLNGGDGNDTLTDLRSATSNGGVALIGGAGNDTLTGGPLSNTFSPGPGADKVRGGSLPTDTDSYRNFVKFGGNPGTYQRDYAGDFVSYSDAAAGVNVSLDDQANDGTAGEGDDIGSDVETVNGSPFNDVLTAGAGAAELNGGAGDDTLTGGPGDDSLFGGFGQAGGTDTVNGNDGDDFIGDGDQVPFQQPAPGAPAAPAPGADKLNGGNGNDAFSDGAGADDIVGGPGDDSLSLERDATAPNPTPSDYVSVPLGFTVTLDDQANDGPTGAGEGDNVHSDVEDVDTGGGDDVIVGSAAPNTFFTGAGNDNVTGGAGSDDIFTGTGDDTIAVQDGITDRVDGDRGNDTASVDLGGGQPEKADVLFNVENVTGVPLPSVVDVTKIPVTPPNAAPTLSVSGLTVTSKSFLKSGTFSIKVTTNEPSTVVADLLGKNKFRAVGDIVVGTGRLGLGTGKRTVKVSVGKSNLKTLKRKLRTKAQKKKGVSFRLRVVATDALGLPRSTTKTFKIKG